MISSRWKRQTVLQELQERKCLFACLWILFHSYAPFFPLKAASVTPIHTLTHTQSCMSLIFGKLWKVTEIWGIQSYVKLKKGKKSVWVGVGIHINTWWSSLLCIYLYILLYSDNVYNHVPKLLHCLHNYCLSDYYITLHRLMYRNSITCSLILDISISSICDYNQSCNEHLCIVCCRHTSPG